MPQNPGKADPNSTILSWKRWSFDGVFVGTERGVWVTQNHQGLNDYKAGSQNEKGSDWPPSHESLRRVMGRVSHTMLPINLVASFQPQVRKGCLIQMARCHPGIHVVGSSMACGLLGATI